jgi:hypothetical protein
VDGSGLRRDHRDVAVQHRGYTLTNAQGQVGEIDGITPPFALSPVVALVRVLDSVAGDDTAVIEFVGAEDGPLLVGLIALIVELNVYLNGFC